MAAAGLTLDRVRISLGPRCLVEVDATVASGETLVELTRPM